MRYTPDKHPHAEAIKAWADGARILVRTSAGADFTPVIAPMWFFLHEYHAVPNDVPQEYLQLYIAWKNGAKIQWHNGNRWEDCVVHPRWSPSIQYRAKPKGQRVRLFLWRPAGEEARIILATEKEQQREPRENWSGFVRWASDWIEVEAAE